MFMSMIFVFEKNVPFVSYFDVSLMKQIRNKAPICKLNQHGFMNLIIPVDLLL